MSEASVSEKSEIEPAGAKPTPAVRPDVSKQEKRKNLPRFNVILLDDNDHTYQYVIEMLASIFGFNQQMGYQKAREVDKAGRTIVFTGHRELAELKQGQIHAFGNDKRIARCAGSMRAVIEPVDA
ncbi:MAG: ATP-dependent Clp protease adaptor ClpS [Phycisphaerae bacterium]